jgi:hypothetical protein
MEVGGLFGPIRVGAGKSLTCALIPTVLEAKRPVLLMPASLVSKTWDERKVLKEHWRLPSNVQIISYESLSLVQSAQKLEYIQPDLLVCDEAHFLKGHRAGRTRRVVRYMNDCPETKFVAVSGTIMKSSVRDFAHLLRFALKGHAPIPSTEDEVAAWAECLDEKVNPLARRRPGAIFDLGARVQGANDDTTAARLVFQARLLDTKGVVASSKSDGVDCSIRIEALEYELSPTTEEHFETLRRRSETPCGKSFAEAAEMRMYARELALGFTYTWIPKEKAAEWESLAKKRENPGPGSARGVGEPTTRKSKGRVPNAATKQPVSNSAERRVDAGEMPTSSETENATGVGAKPTQKAPKPVTEKVATGLPYSSIKSFLSIRSASARSAVGSEGREDSVSITTTRQAGSEGSFAATATPPSGNSERILLGLDGPSRTFLERNKPPSEWLEARKAWCSFVREQIEQSHQYDTMLQVANACRAGLLPSVTLDAWKGIESSYEPLTRPIFYETTALETCLSWMQQHVGIVWVEHRAFGEALSELSDTPYFGPGGLDASGQGFNLQMFSKNLITSCPSGASTIEQVLGRTHRDGQIADEVLVWILLGCREHFDAFDKALEGAKAAEAMLGHSQKLLLADVILPNIENRKGPLWG